MNFQQFKHISLLYTLILCIGLLSVTPAFSEQQFVQDTLRADDAERIPRQATWEKIACAPLGLVYLPFRYTLKGAGLSVGYINDTKIIAKIDDYMKSDDLRRQIQPTYAERTGAGLHYFQNGILISNVRQNVLRLTASIGYEGTQLYRATLDSLMFSKLQYDFSSGFIVRYWNIAAEPYFGIGPATREDDESNFALEQTLIEGSVSTIVRDDYNARVFAGFEYTNIAEGREEEKRSTTEYPDSEAPGINDRVQMTYFRVEADLDTRNRPGNPSNGLEVSAATAFYQQINSSRFGFTRLGFDISKYTHLFYDRVFVARTAIETTIPLGGREIPFYYLSELGNEETIRGFRTGRYRDRHSLLASLEYRYPVWRNWDEYGLDFFLFLDTGQVSRDLFSYARWDYFRTGYGFGIRLWDQSSMISRLQIGFNEDDVRIYLSINQGG